ncbi:MAG: hypothetical protein H8D92_00745 [Pelagibacteraceae bacterium]|nr:hypothetical protein [Pelagibacteraceae bacterium]
MKQIIAAMAAMVISASSIAGIALSGKYTGTLNDSGVYTQDLTTTLVGSSAAGAVTVTLDKDFAVDDMYVESTLAGVKFKLGEVDDVTSIGASTTVGPATVGVNQVSGGSTTFDAGMSISGVKVDVTNITNTARATTASASVAGFALAVEHAKVGTDHQLEMSASRTILSTTDANGVTSGGWTISVDRGQNAARDAYSDGAMGASVSTSVSGIGTVKAEVSNSKTKVKTYGLSVTSGIFTGAWDKVGSADGSLSLKAVVKF